MGINLCVKSASKKRIYVVNKGRQNSLLKQFLKTDFQNTGLK
ncbi:hypothetical protein HPTD01_555 [Halomonas sp. TD01]|nr:hypothetical protein HPTD01_555 [Halomonas sp. TD01]